MAIGHLWKEGKKNTIFQKKKICNKVTKTLCTIHKSNPEKFSSFRAYCIVYVTDVSTCHMTGTSRKEFKKKTTTVVTYRIIMMPHVAVRNFPHWKWVLEGRESHPFLREMLITGTRLLKNLFYTESSWAVKSPRSH